MRRFAFFLFLFCHQSAFSDTTNKVPSITPSSTNRAPGLLKLVVGPSSCPVPGGTVELTVGVLNLQAGAFVGDYRIKVLPYVIGGEKGKLSMTAPDESLRKLTNAMAVDFIGMATDTKSVVKRIDGTITPSSRDKGKVMLWFMSGKRKMIFNTTYQLQTK